MQMAKDLAQGSGQEPGKVRSSTDSRAESMEEAQDTAWRSITCMLSSSTFMVLLPRARDKRLVRPDDTTPDDQSG